MPQPVNLETYSDEDFESLSNEIFEVKRRRSARTFGPSQAWYLAEEYAKAGRDPHDLLDSIQAYIDGEPCPEPDFAAGAPTPWHPADEGDPSVQDAALDD